MKKSNDPYETLLAYRSTPLKNGYSPAVLLMGRRLRTTLPVAEKLLLPQKVDHETVKQREEELKLKQKQQYDEHHGVRSLSDLDIGEDVWIIDMQQQGCVKGPATTPRSYIVATENGELRRNRSHLIPLRQTSQEQPIVESTDHSGLPMQQSQNACADVSHMHTRSGLCIKPKRF